MATLLLLLTLTVFLAALGRDAIPPAERLPLRAWTWRDLAVNVVRGARLLPQFNARQRRRLEVYLDELQPWHSRRPDHHDGSTRRRDRCGDDPC